MPDPLRVTALTALASIPANPANLLFYAVDLTELDPDDQSKKMALTLLDSRFATAAQGALAATALQSAAAFATAAQGVKADSALQAAAIGVTVQAYNASLAAITAFGYSLIDDADAAAGRTTLVAAGTGVANTFAAAQTMQGPTATAIPLTLRSTDDNVTNPWLRILNSANNSLASFKSETGIGIYLRIGANVTGQSNPGITLDSAAATGSSGPVMNWYRGGVHHWQYGVDSSGQGGANGFWWYNVPNAFYAFSISALGGMIVRAKNVAAITLAGVLHDFQIGLAAATNLAMNTTSIQARSNGAAATLNLNPLGGTVKTNQASTTAAIPALWLIQADVSEEFIRFESTVGAGNAINTTALGAYYGRVRVYVEGVGAKWLALYD